jgi:retron-type reverse transcriptase
MLNTRLRWFVDKQSKPDPAQSGFRPGRSTIDNPVQLETKVLTGMANKYTGAVFIDISKAFDLVWLDGLIYKLRHLFHITCSALCFIRSFLKGRKIQVTVNQETSELHSLIDNGTPQGSVISPTLFNLMINDLSTTIQHQKQPYQVPTSPSLQMTQKLPYEWLYQNDKHQTTKHIRLDL